MSIETVQLGCTKISQILVIIIDDVYREVSFDIIKELELYEIQLRNVNLFGPNHRFDNVISSMHSIKDLVRNIALVKRSLNQVYMILQRTINSCLIAAATINGTEKNENDIADIEDLRFIDRHNPENESSLKEYFLFDNESEQSEKDVLDEVDDIISLDNAKADSDECEWSEDRE